jgi:5-methylcytosine-specific restriction enzyme A
MAQRITPEAARERMLAALELIDSGLAVLRDAASNTVGNGPTKGDAGDREMLRGFLERQDALRHTAELIRSGIDSSELQEAGEIVPDIDLETEAPEGRLLERRHLARERDAGLRAKKIAKHLQTHGQLACTICGFDFKAAYGEHGDGYIECHHVVPLHASGETITRLDDLILICSNCHRMIHRRTPWLTPEQLSDLIAANHETSHQPSNL